MQTLFTHVAKIGLDYIVCDPTVPCPPTPTPPGPSVIPSGGPQEHVPDTEVFWYYNELGDPQIGTREEAEAAKHRRVHVIVCTAEVSAIVTTAEVGCAVTTAHVSATVGTDDE